MSSIQQTALAMGVLLPDVYKELVTSMNGVSMDSGACIYGVDDLAERNDTWEVQEYARGFVAIGDDGGGNVFLMRQRAEERAVIVVDCGDLNPQNGVVITQDLEVWVRNGCPDMAAQYPTADVPDICDVVLVAKPKDGLNDLLNIKKVFGADMSTPALLHGSKHLPFVVVRDFPYGKAVMLLRKLGSSGESLILQPSMPED